MPGDATRLGPFTGGLHNSSGTGEFIDNAELYDMVNMEVDTDGSLVNRPEISLFTMTGINSSATSMLGVYLPSDGRKLLVVYNSVQKQVHIVDSSTGASLSNTPANTEAVCCIQYGGLLFVPAKPGSLVNGGYFSAPTSSTVTWTAHATLPKGEAITLYRERLWIACGLSAVADTSRFYFSPAGLPQNAWNVGVDFIDVAAGNGQKLVSLTVLGQDMVLFKEHSTHRFTYTTDPRKAQLDQIDAAIGNPAINCHVVYNNNTIYVMHDNSVYELFQYTFTRISANINMVQETDLDLFAKDQYGLTLHRDRLFVRYFKNLYVYAIRVKRWSRWDSVRKFSKVVVIPSATVGLDTAYASSASISLATQSYLFKDDRRTSDDGVIPQNPQIERFTASINTKTYDFDVPHAYKVMFMWGISVATSGKVAAELVIPNARRNATYQELQNLYSTFAAAQSASVTWASNTPVVVHDDVLPSLGRYSRKYLKVLKKVRFRQIYFTLVMDVITNHGLADASIRLYDLTVFLKQKELVVKETS